MSDQMSDQPSNIEIVSPTNIDLPSPLKFFSVMKWLDGSPLMNVIEPYRQKIFMDALYSFDAEGNNVYNMVLCGRGKKNFKTCDLVLAAFWKFFLGQSPQGTDCYLLANDKDQACDDLVLAKKLLEANPALETLVKVQSNKIILKSGRGVLEILPARDVDGSHGKSSHGVFFDEIHAYKNHDLFEALAPDPTRNDSIMWVTTYDSLVSRKGQPLHDFKQRGIAGDDPRFLFTWYAGDETGTDPDYKDLPTPELRANPSIKNFYPGYLEQQRLRLPTNKYRRLHLNLPGAPDGAFLDPERVLACIISGRKQRRPVRAIYVLGQRVDYQAFVDPSGGSSDDFTMSIAHVEKPEDSDEPSMIVLDYIDKQPGEPPFSPRVAVKKFATVLKEYGINKVTGDSYAGQTFVSDFEDHGIVYEKSPLSKSDLYQELEPVINAGGVELLDHPMLEGQLLTLVSKGSKVDHLPGGHDDHANAVAGAVYLCKEETNISLSSWAVALEGLSGESRWTPKHDDGYEGNNGLADAIESGNI